jgi:hypothetical protein
VTRQKIRIGSAHAGKLITVVTEDTCRRWAGTWSRSTSSYRTANHQDPVRADHRDGY